LTWSILKKKALIWSKLMAWRAAAGLTSGYPAAGARCERGLADWTEICVMAKVN
jgi:hypothetical protein